MFRLLWQKKALILFLVVLVVLLPTAMSRPAQMMSKTVLTEITIDKVGEQYTLTGKKAEISSPSAQAGGLGGGGGAGSGAPTEKKELTASGPSVAAAINKMSATTEKEVSFAHCSSMVLGEGLAGENLADLLEFFLHRTEIHNNIALSWKEKGRATTLEKFYKDYMRSTSTSILAEGPTKSAVFKHGKYAFTLDEAQTLALDFALGRPIKERIIIEADAPHVLKVLSNNTQIKNNSVKVAVKMELESNPQATDTELLTIKDAVKEKLEKDIKDTLEFCYGKNADVLLLYKLPTEFIVKVDASV